MKSTANQRYNQPATAPSLVTVANKDLPSGASITYTKQFMFNKSGEETAKVVYNDGKNLLLDNGDRIRYA
tara:strand:+ start:20 stop:229 length:210 start_codon:yes stop_codon:yes gene_type:complete